MLDDLLTARPGGTGPRPFAAQEEKGINFTMFLTMMSERLFEFDTETELREAFECFDEGDTGSVKVDEMRKWMSEVGERMDQHEVPPFVSYISLQFTAFPLDRQVPQKLVLRQTRQLQLSGVDKGAECQRRKRSASVLIIIRFFSSFYHKMYVYHILIILSYPLRTESVVKIQIHCPSMGSAGNLSFSIPSSLNISSVGSCDSLSLTSFRTACDISLVS